MAYSVESGVAYDHSEQSERPPIRLLDARFLQGVSDYSAKAEVHFAIEAIHRACADTACPMFDERNQSAATFGCPDQTFFENRMRCTQRVEQARSYTGDLPLLRTRWRSGGYTNLRYRWAFCGPRIEAGSGWLFAAIMLEGAGRE
jgi:hypothetical protein